MTVDMNIEDEILYLDREYRDRFRGQPKILKVGPAAYARLLEHLGYDPILDELTTYHGMEIEVNEDYEDEVEIE